MRKATDIAAQIWCKPTLEHKVMDPELCAAFAEELERWRQPNLGLATTRQLIDELSCRCEINGTIGYATVEEFCEKREVIQEVSA